MTDISARVVRVLLSDLNQLPEDIRDKLLLSDELTTKHCLHLFTDCEKARVPPTMVSAMLAKHALDILVEDLQRFEMSLNEVREVASTLMLGLINEIQERYEDEQTEH